jgi:aminoglycoside phosphotransferase (APT) family kinase protein
MFAAAPSCLVHGDMHAGNVMLEVSAREGEPGSLAERVHDLDRVSLIDFRNAGPGPRSMDAVALESSIRLADSEARCRSSSVSGEKGLSDGERYKFAEEMASRVTEELELYRSAFGDVGNTEAFVGWRLAAAQVLKGLRQCFPELELEEYLCTSIRYTLRQLGFEMDPVARVRILSWLAAQYALLRERL